MLRAFKPRDAPSGYNTLLTECNFKSREDRSSSWRVSSTFPLCCSLLQGFIFIRLYFLLSATYRTEKPSHAVLKSFALSAQLKSSLSMCTGLNSAHILLYEQTLLYTSPSCIRLTRVEDNSWCCIMSHQHWFVLCYKWILHWGSWSLPNPTRVDITSWFTYFLIDMFPSGGEKAAEFI